MTTCAPAFDDDFDDEFDDEDESSCIEEDHDICPNCDEEYIDCECGYDEDEDEEDDFLEDEEEDDE